MWPAHSPNRRYQEKNQRNRKKIREKSIYWIMLQFRLANISTSMCVHIFWFRISWEKVMPYLWIGSFWMVGTLILLHSLGYISVHVRLCALCLTHFEFIYIYFAANVNNQRHFSLNICITLIRSERATFFDLFSTKNILYSFAHSLNLNEMGSFKYLFSALLVMCK